MSALESSQSGGVPPFHLAFPVSDLEATRVFYAEILGCPVGRRSENWIDFDFFGHQISAHLAPDECARVATNPVDGDAVPTRHFGAVLPWAQWEELSKHLGAKAVPFLFEPHIRFQGEVGQQGTFFVLDPSGNALEFKAFMEPRRLFDA